MKSSRRSSVEGSDKIAEVSAATAPSTPRAPSAPTGTAKLQRLVSSLAITSRAGLISRQASALSSVTASATPVEEPYTPSEDALALIKSFRRKKYIRTRLLMPLQSNDALPRAHKQRRWSPRKADASPRKQAPLTLEQQSVVARLSEKKTDEPHDREEHEDEGRDDGEDEIAQLQRVHALLASQDEVSLWIASYETEKSQFTSFALLTEMKLDEIQDKYTARAGRPNAVEAAACCATLLQMPGIVGCYRTLLEKLVVGIQSVVYLPVDNGPVVDTPVKEDQSMATIVRSFYARKPYFQRTHELEMQLRNARSLTDPSVIKTLTVDELKALALQVPVRKMATGIVDAYASHLPHLDHLLATIHEKKLQIQLEFYQLHGHHQRRVANRRRSSAGGSGDDDDDFDAMADDVDYPITVPLTSSAQICRAISQHATTFSSSGKEMILCSILEHIEIDSFKDVFKRFDAHGKTCFLHHLSVFESSDHLQLILEQLPNAGDTLFRFYYVICGGGGSGKLDETGAGSNPKHVFFQKVLSAEMEFFFLCDLAGYLNDEQWTLLSQEYEKHAQERKARRKRLRNRRRLAGAGNGDGDEEEDDGQEGGEDGDADADDENFQVPDQKKTLRSSSKASLEHFQLMVWNYLHHHKLTSPQIWSLVQNVLLASMEEPESLACIDHCIDRLSISNRWKKLLGLVEDMEPDSDAAAKDEVVETEHEIVRQFRCKMLKRLFAMLSREEQATWMDKTTAKYGVLTNKPPPPARKPEVVVVQTPQKPPNLDDPKPWMAQMRLDVKMLWIEALLNALTNDKETSARTAMLKQMLVPFLNGQMPAAPAPVVVQEKPPQPEVIMKMTLADAEKDILAIVAQLRQHRPGEDVKLWQNILPEHLRPPPPVVTTERASSPIPELTGLDLPKSKDWLESTTSNPEIATAFRALLEVKSEAEVLAILQRATKKNETSENQDEDDEEEEDDYDHKLTHASSSIRNMVKRKVSAVVAVSQPMEWQERVKVGMQNETTQTDFLDMTVLNESPTKPAAVATRAPLTLTALLGRQSMDKTGPSGSTSPRRKGDAKFQKLNNAAVPKAIAGLITSWRVNTDQLMQFAKKTMPTVLRLIADAYGEMLTAGRRKANFLAISSAAVAAATASGHRGTVKELSLAQIVYQQFLHSYGLPGIADMHLLAFSCALEAYRLQHLRVELFARFVFEEVSKLEMTNFLEFLECLVCDDAAQANGGSATTTNNSTGNNNAAAQGPVMTKRQRFVPRITVPDKENWMVPLEKAQEAAQLCFRAMRKQAVTAFCEKLTLLSSQGASSYVPGGSNMTTQPLLPAATGPSVDTGRSSPPPFGLAAPPANTGNQAAATEGPMINADHLLQLVVDEWREEQLRREGHLLNVFRAGDVNGDGELTSAEFTHIVLAIDHTRDLGDIMLMYSDTLRRTQCEAIDAEIFLQVAKEYELDRAAWNEDGELRNIVNDMNELQETWQHTRKFFLGTLEALARDLPTMHFLRVCEGAGCGCLKCILDGYIGFQRMRRDYYTSTNPRVSSMGSTARHRSTAVSEALLWARFWHLMRQLYEACSESPGIITPWDGADYMRVEAAPRPPPRYLKYRRMALPNFLFPDTDRISGMVSKIHEQVPEVFDRETILHQFATLMDLMSFTASGKNGSNEAGQGASNASS